jgi:hypothetical protein
MAEGWLPPQAPGGQPPPRFDMVVPDRVEPRQAPPAVPDAFAASASTRPAPGPAVPNGLALTAVILGVLGVLLLLLTLGLLWFIALPCSIAAWMCGAQARNRINLGEVLTGRGQANAGYLLGVAGVVIGVAAAIGWIVYFANGGNLDELQQDLERWRDEQTREAMFDAVRAIFGR